MGNIIRSWPSGLATGLLLLGMAMPASALAQGDFERHIGEAHKLYEETEYERALLELQRAERFAQGDEQLSRLAIYKGLIVAETGSLKKARPLLEEGLKRNPWATLPMKVSPKLEAAFEKTRDGVLQNVQFEISADALADLKKPFVWTEPILARPAIALNSPKEPFSLAQQPRPEFRYYCKSTPWTTLGSVGLGAAFFGAGAAFGFQSKANIRDASRAFQQDQAESTLRTARGNALAANVSFVLAGALVATAAGTGWYWRQMTPDRNCSDKELLERAP